MTPQERHAYLIKLGTEAVASALREFALQAPEGSMVTLPDLICAHMSERMAQAAMIWGGEIDEAGR